MSTRTRQKIDGLQANEKAPRPVPQFRLGNYKINWLSTTIIMLPPVVVAYAVFWLQVPLLFSTFLTAVASYFFAGLGITLGYHRLFSHRAFNASKLVKYFFGFAGSGALQGSIKWWSRNHRIHHRYIDTDKDPYNAKRGFFYSHLGWMLMKQDYELLGHVDISDLNADKFVRFQHNHYLELSMLSGLILPMALTWLINGDWLGGLMYAGFAKVVVIHHTTFFINSLAHSSFLGASQNFSDNHSSYDSFVCAILTLGEGYHNFHHEFAQDYRNGTKWYHYDPTKWVIRALEMCGLAKGLVRTPNAVIRRNVLDLKAKKHAEASRELEKKIEKDNAKHSQADTLDWNEIEALVAQGRKLTVVGDYVLDFEKTIPTGAGYTHKSTDMVWYNMHPGGRKLLDMYVGKDATDAVTGGIYKHSQGAFNLFQHLRVASLKRTEDI